MAMNIKNPETEQLARELAEVTGESLTAAVTEALRERLVRVRNAATRDDPRERAQRILEIGAAIEAALPEPSASRTHGELLYDESGLPA
jgi:antitoxin VapB